MTQRTIDDVPQHLKDTYKPKLVEAFRAALEFQTEIGLNPGEASMTDISAAISLEQKFEEITEGFINAGGCEEDLELVMMKAQEESGFNPGI
tara:strand:+ start:159689 stop:159964 length:276 start_codon:yes stop_codon:yes gene_type:complete